MTDERLEELLRAAMPLIAADRPGLDVWPSVVDRIDRRPAWSMLDLGLAAGVIATLLVFPEWLWLLAYHL